MIETEVFDMIFDVLGAVIGVMKSISFLGISIFHWLIGFLIMSAVISYLLNTANSTHKKSNSRPVRRKKEKD